MAKKLTHKQIEETYKGKRFDPKDVYSTITTIVYSDGLAILLSGSYCNLGAGYCLEAAIDLTTGQNVIAGRWRYADTKDDAIDVLGEMLNPHYI